MVPQRLLDVPRTPEFGELSSSICFDLSKRLQIEPRELAEKIVKDIDLSKARLVKSINAAGKGFINFYTDYAKLSSLTIESARKLDVSYGYIKTKKPLKIIVEHTSANPAGPIHVGTARNSVIGDSLTHLLKARGHKVAAHFYIDDVGRQIAIMAYGYQILGQPEPEGKPDHWIGLVYAATSCIIAIQSLKMKIKEFKGRPELEEDLKKTLSELDDWVVAAADLRDRNAELFDGLLDRIEQDKNPELNVARIMRLYEEENPKTKKLVRRVVEFCLDGFRKTYGRVGIRWDSWDWESGLVWSGAVSDVVDKLRETPYFTESEGALAVDVERAARETGLKRKLGIPEEHEIPPLVLTRSDGTTLYTTRDIAYSLWKFESADRVINVIGAEQSLAQTQLRMAVSILTSPERAEDLIHFAYELVDLPGYRMSRRRGRFVSFDEILDESVKRAYEEVEKHSPGLSKETKENIAESVGIGAVKYTLISVAPSKPVVFIWDKVLNFKMNSAPFIQYAYARACNILNKAEGKPKHPDCSLLTDPLERELIRKIATFPETFVDATENFWPSSIAEFANDLADKFNSFYATLPVLRAEGQDMRDARLALVDAVRITMRNALNLLGIKALERM